MSHRLEASSRMKITKRALTRFVVTLVLALIATIFWFHPGRPLWIKNDHFTVRTPDGVSLGATLSVPRWKKPIGAVVLVHGSGPLTREHVSGDVRSLVANGFAVLHYDKRGSGSSQGEYMPSSSNPMTRIVEVLAADAATMMANLQGRFENHSIKFGFFGASQAGWILPLAVSKCRSPPSFLVIISGTPASTGLEGYYSDLTGDGTRPPRVHDPRELRRLTLAFDGEPGFDPMPLWESLACPTLWLLGESDRSVPTFVSVEILEKHIRKGHPEHKVVRFPNSGHDLRDVDTGQAADIWPLILGWYQSLQTR